MLVYFFDTDQCDPQAKRRILNEQLGLDGIAQKAGLQDLAEDMVQDDDLLIVHTANSDSQSSRVWTNLCCFLICRLFSARNLVY